MSQNFADRQEIWCPLLLCQVRDLQKKMQHVENELDITLEKLTQTTTKLDEKEKAYAVAEGEIQALKRKIALLEDELER